MPPSGRTVADNLSARHAFGIGEPKETRGLSDGGPTGSREAAGPHNPQHQPELPNQLAPRMVRLHHGRDYELSRECRDARHSGAAAGWDLAEEIARRSRRNGRARRIAGTGAGPPALRSDRSCDGAIALGACQAPGRHGVSNRGPPSLAHGTPGAPATSPGRGGNGHGDHRRLPRQQRVAPNAACRVPDSARPQGESRGLDPSELVTKRVKFLRVKTVPASAGRYQEMWPSAAEPRGSEA